MTLYEHAMLIFFVNSILVVVVIFAVGFGVKKVSKKIHEESK